MRVVAFSVKNYEKELLAKANQKKHDITLISNKLDEKSCCYAKGKDAVLVFVNDDLSAPIINKLADLGIKYIATRSAGTDHIDLACAQKRGIKVANIPNYSPEAIAEFGVCLAMALSRKLVQTCAEASTFDFRIENHMGFNFYGKTVGILGLGKIGLATARIYHGMGCSILGYDSEDIELPEYIKQVSLTEALEKADILSLHTPLVKETTHLLNAATLAKVKTGVLIVNTSRGGIVNTEAIITALESGKVGYFGTDVYEFEKGLFFFNHSEDEKKDPLLRKLMSLKNVLVSPHQAFLTKEAVQQIEEQTIAHLDAWQHE
ncbi:MAG: 2-hydroxyacid dehydrogenase [Sphingobacteriaceae bacterium]